MPTTLGQLPTNEPVPTGLVQLKRGAVGTPINMNNTVSARPMEDGAGNPMRISITPPRRGWWVIRAETIWSVPDAVWTYWHWMVRIVPNDLVGYPEDRNHVASHQALGWQESVINCAYFLEANTAYYAEMYWPNATAGYNQQYWAGGEYHYIMGEFVGEGAY